MQSHNHEYIQLCSHDIVLLSIITILQCYHYKISEMCNSIHYYRIDFGVKLEHTCAIIFHTVIQGSMTAVIEITVTSHKSKHTQVSEPPSVPVLKCSTNRCIHFLSYITVFSMCTSAGCFYTLPDTSTVVKRNSKISRQTQCTDAPLS